MADAEFRALLRVLLDGRGMSVPALARATSYSRQYVWEVASGRKQATAEVAQAFDEALGADGSLLATVCESNAPRAEGGDMRRRQVLVGVPAAVGVLAVDGGALAGVAGALLRPDSGGPPLGVGELRAAVEAARQDFAGVRYRQLAARLPALVAAVEASGDTPDGRRGDVAVLGAQVYGLAARLAVKLHEQGVAWAAVDRAGQAARQAGCPRAVATAARTAAVVLRRDGRHDQAQQVIVDAAERLRVDSPSMGGRDASLYAAMLATAAYTAAIGDSRDEAWTYADEAAGVLAAAGGGAGFGANEMELYRSGIARALGDFGQAVHHARRVRVEGLPTPERRARCWEDTALAWWGRGRRAEAWEALREAEVAAPQEVRYRPWAQRLTLDLLESGPTLPGLRGFAARVGVSA